MTIVSRLKMYWNYVIESNIMKLLFIFCRSRMMSQSIKIYLILIVNAKIVTLINKYSTF